MSDDPLPRCICPWQQDYHNDDCPQYLELMARIRAHRAPEET